MALVTSAWATLRFRRSKDVKGWALLGIPEGLYPDVMQPLFERQTRFIEKHGRGEFVNVLFEAPVALAARLALAFPAPPSCEPLVVNQAGNRLLYGKFALSAKARHQAQEHDAWPGLELLTGEESFWQVVTTLSSVATLPLDRLHVPGETRDNQASPDEQVVRSSSQASTSLPQRGSAAETALQSLARGGLKLQPAAALARPELESSTRRGIGEEVLDEQRAEDDGWEEDDWEEEEAQALDEESFEDIWDTDESADFWDNVPAKPSPGTASAAVRSIASSLPFTGESGARGNYAVGESAIAPPSLTRIAAQSPVSSSLRPNPGHPVKTSQPSATHPRAVTPPKPRQSTQPSAKKYRAKTAQPSGSGQFAKPSSAAKPVVSEASPTPTILFASQPAPQANLSSATTPANQALGRYRSGLVPHPSDSSSLQVYNSGGLTVADAIARSHQQEAEAQAIAEQAQHRRIQLPFERSPTVFPQYNPAQQGSQPRPSWSYASPTPQLPEESWAASAMEQSALRPVEPAWEAHNIQPNESWSEYAGDSPEGMPPRHNPWLPPSQQPLWEAESSPYLAAAELDVGVNAVPAETVEWGYYDEQGNWIACDPVMAEPSADASGGLVPAPEEIFCRPVEEEHGHILLQGVAVWNDWRLANPQIRPNLRGAYLNNLDLAGADLHDVDLRFALLFRADLREADLSLAALVGADLIRADLGGASLWGACLNGAYLSHANLAGADLTQADLQGVYCQGAILAGAMMPDGQLFEEQS